MSFDFDSATEYQKKRLHRIAHNNSLPFNSETSTLADFLFPRQILFFFLTLDGKREICEIGSVRFPKDKFDDINRPTKLLDSLPITYREELTVFESDEGEEDRFLPWWHICSDGRDINVEFGGGMSDEDWGEFYGYPEWAIQAFVNDETVITEDIEASELEFSADELKYLQLLPYTIPLEESRIQESIEKAKVWAERIEELANEYEYLSGLSYRLDEVLLEQKEEVEYRRYRRQQNWE